jgi:endonuclease VIII
VAEGDTILRAARRIEAALHGGTVEASAPNPRGRVARIERLDGRGFERASTHGKHLLLYFGELVLHSHLGMSGSWHAYRRGEPWRKPLGAAWAVLSTERAEAVQFGGPTLRLLRAEAVHSDPVLARLGPDVLSPAFDAGLIAQSLASAPGRGLGDALLDQHLVAGIGNIFKSEACFAARLDPWQRVAGVPAEQLRHVAQAAHDLMLEAVEAGRQDRAVYKRAGRPCPRCGTKIRSRGQGDANRTTYWCPSCQIAGQAPAT